MLADLEDRHLRCRIVVPGTNANGMAHQRSEDAEPDGGLAGRLEQATMGKSETKVAELCAEPGVPRQTLYRHVTPEGEIRPDGETLLARWARAAS